MARFRDDDDDAFDENGLLKDGRRVRVGLMMRDADALSPLQRSVARDARFGLQDAADLYAPGPRYCDAAGRERKAEAYQQMCAELQDAWKMLPAPTEAADGRETGWEEEDARPAIPVTDADYARLRQIKQVAYERAKAEAQDAFKNPSALAADAEPPERQDAAPVPRTMTADAARRIKRAAYNEMVDEMTSAWKGPAR